MNMHSRYSLKTLLIAITCICIVLGLTGYMIRRCNRQNITVQELRGTGALVLDHINGQDIGSKRQESLLYSLCNLVSSAPVVIEIDAGGCDLSGVNLSHLQDLSDIQRLRFDRSNFTSQQINDISCLSSVNYLDLADTPTCDHSMTSIASMKGLCVLHLDGTRVTDEGMAPLCSLKLLRELSLSRTSVSSKGVKTLAALSHLQVLDLSNTMINDDAIEWLSQNHELKAILIYETKVSERAIAKMKERLANVEVFRD
jgi:hypothetical protein